MKTALVKNLAIGDIVKVVDPLAEARIASKEKSKLFIASGGCWRLDLAIISGPHKGQTIRDQHHPGDLEIELAGNGNAHEHHHT